MEILRVASLFAGIGGIDLGFKQAGFDIVWANEVDEAACRTYRYNLGSDHLIQGDIRKIPIENIPDFDILVAGFPCQPFSLAGKQRGFCDERGKLFFEIKRVIVEKRPQVVFLENVANLIEHDNGKSFEQVYLALMEEGYIVRYSTQNPRIHANIPQQRDRVFIVAFLDVHMANKFKYPEEKPLMTKITDFIRTNEKHDERYYYTSKSKYYSDLHNVVEYGYLFKINEFGVCKKKYEICPTLTASMGQYTTRIPIVKDKCGIRYLTPYECLRFQGFPSSFLFPKNISLEEAYKQIGNSVCVPIIQNIAQNIMNVLTKKL